MKRFYLVLLLVLSPYSPQIMNAAVGCMSTSTELKVLCDSKQLHYVQCNCPCGSSGRYEILSRRGLCRECGHYHALKRMQILSTNKVALATFLARRPVSNNPFVRYFQERNSLIF